MCFLSVSKLGCFQKGLSLGHATQLKLQYVNLVQQAIWVLQLPRIQWEWGLEGLEAVYGWATHSPEQHCLGVVLPWGKWGPVSTEAATVRPPCSTAAPTWTGRKIFPLSLPAAPCYGSTLLGEARAWSCWERQVLCSCHATSPRTAQPQLQEWI